ncbi:hypothetical protein [Deinococcus soli (ex Cha et al. 2016)]|uniref:Uncharacterized protein n=2 Tax=Deinococcus soli (ex Cha et al. 2016) TaxID=1309411 RepID=A0AAE4BK55_9DEIO|nr:hypothetical protein [Deinococcus soli (ex Cha et al. 2016)]MDR6217308.1 hypothetical protein [Deinococcus soli (ex Cha et al. 2016)]MDR6326617.1 hypothetical protein [Deinococcus soli (ex Cha et al. 2016)]MDR6750656.1 hypothetical protein [Deinococcus soli (ex Cha et al. 2016)]
MHVPTLPSGTHPIGNNRVQPAPPDYRLQVQCVGQWHPVTPHPGEDTRTLLQSPYCAVQDGWITGARSPLG